MLASWAALACVTLSPDERLLAQPQRVLRIATQPGIGYGQLIVIQNIQMLEKRVPGLRVEWQKLTSGPVIRDAMLASAGKLNLKRPEASPTRRLQMVEMLDNGPQARAILDTADSSRAAIVIEAVGNV